LGTKESGRGTKRVFLQKGSVFSTCLKVKFVRSEQPNELRVVTGAVLPTRDELGCHFIKLKSGGGYPGGVEGVSEVNVADAAVPLVIQEAEPIGVQLFYIW
jgi:hypothetical protein